MASMNPTASYRFRIINMLVHAGCVLTAIYPRNPEQTMQQLPAVLWRNQEYERVFCWTI
jgi:hypothetical protein